MSISILTLGTTGIKDAIKWHLREHSSEIMIVGIMVTIGIGIGVLATGDIMEGLAKGRR
jgi:hypothetical protein